MTPQAKNLMRDMLWESMASKYELVQDRLNDAVLEVISDLREDTELLAKLGATNLTPGIADEVARIARGLFPDWCRYVAQGLQELDEDEFVEFITVNVSLTDPTGGLGS